MQNAELNDNWNAICQCISTYTDVDHPQFDAFASRMQIQAMSQGFALITTENSFLKNWVEKNFKDTISRAFKDVFGVDFVIALDVDEDQSRVNNSEPSLTPRVTQVQSPQPQSVTTQGINSQLTNYQAQSFIDSDVNSDFHRSKNITPQSHFSGTYPEMPEDSDSDDFVSEEYFRELQNFDDSGQVFRNLTFENYVIGESNRLAYSSALKVAESPGRPAFNPLFIYGKSGLGKTHLMRAIQNYINKTQPQLRVVYADSEELLSGYTNAVAEHDSEKLSYKNFKTKYESADVLLIDDIQFLQGKIQTLDIVFQIFNKLINQGKQIVLSADRAPKNIDLEERYSSRFMQGGTVDIQAPEIETKLAIVKSYIKEYIETEHDSSLVIPEDIQMYIAENSGSNVRELKGAVNIVIYHMTYSKNHELTITEVNQLLENHFSGMISKNLTIDDIQKEVENFYRVKHSDLIGTSRLKEIAYPRHIAIYLCRQLLDLPYDVIGKKFNRKHTTAMNSVTKVDEMLLTNRNVQEEIESLKQIIKDL